ncbi:ribose-phosphate diphosphokinase [Bacillus sp. ISL-40]|uniref:ribose-phosphate diphosphokinase n=1 Tax=unclassified Bacillus (in: firmicutes) TaxID=185979 RepID=UPI001BE5B987|nr:MULTISPECIES: ribose-phosphate diphosphokinase [unclassified Bacillus (in: firmicutes)]MBT2700638.1 ribose-phosphate diphosphokinase [Bacillus sp. ISL-40]MBT2725299.1 ribose-phosphate diphosphokinase [Bacillus sp. ISL-46]MBT2744092.1 ribose-phosphate diphosphokinase [Bacillus sp. ISL-77]
MTYQQNKRFKLFSLNSNQKLAAEIAELLGCELGKSSVSHFSDGEIQIHIEESVRGSEVYIVQSTSYPVNDNILELLIMIDALKRASVGVINVVIPYYGYGRQDRKARSREPITAKLVANLLETTGATRILTMDLHTSQIQGFFDIPVEHLYGVPILGQYFQEKGLEDIVIVAPHNGSIGRARKVANLLHAPIALIDKRRFEENGVETTNVVGNVEGKNVIIIDDLIDTGETIVLAAKALAENGAKAIYAGCTHPVFTDKAIEKIEASPIKELVVTNTIQLPEDKVISKIKTISVAPLLVEAIDRIHNEKAVSPLFE